MVALAIIREAECIGCTKCIQACPVDAIIGSNKLMHSVLADECIGCGLCVEPCPVDCIEMVTQPVRTYDKTLARNRARARKLRLSQIDQDKQQAYQEKRTLAKQDYILQALQRANAKKKS